MAVELEGEALYQHPVRDECKGGREGGREGGEREED